MHGAVGAGAPRRPVPLVEVPALGLVVDVVEEAVLRHQQRVRLEGALWRGLVRGWLEVRKGYTGYVRGGRREVGEERREVGGER